MTTYTIRCEWDPTGWWVVTIPDIPGAVTQARRLDQVPHDVGEIIELMIGEKPGSYDIDIDWSVPGEAGEAAALAHRLREQAEDISDRLDIATRAAVRKLREAGFSYRDVGSMTGVSYQRAQQIARRPVSYERLRAELGFSDREAS